MFSRIFQFWQQPDFAELQEESVILRPMSIGDYEKWYQLRHDSRAHLTRWEPNWTEKETTRKAFVERVRLHNYQIRAGRRYSLLIFQSDADRTMVGGISLSDIRYGNRRSCVLGYWVAEPHTRQGYARSAIRCVCNFAFDRLNLNRIEAACQPGNIASRNLLESSGFIYEGLAKDYLKINGAWRDHEIWALTGGFCKQ